MTDVQAMMGSIAVIVVCLLFVVKAILAWKGKVSLVGKFDKYLPFAIMAAKWVEAKVPDDYGADKEDGKLEKSAHKLDVFLKKFVEIVEKQTGENASAELKDEAMRWSVTLANRVKK